MVGEGFLDVSEQPFALFVGLVTVVGAGTCRDDQILDQKAGWSSCGDVGDVVGLAVFVFCLRLHVGKL